MLDALSTSAAIAAARPSIAVLPIGSIEQHSRHLPLGTDWIAATALAHRVASELDAYLLPALPVSMGRCHKPMAGTVWLRPDDARRGGDGHRALAGGERDPPGRHRQRPRGQLHAGGGRARAEPRASRADRAAAAHEPALERAADLRDGGHGGARRRVGDVRDDGHRRLAGRRRPRRLHPSVGREFLDYAFVGAISPEGVWGKPSLATREKGQRAFDARVDTLVAYVRETLDRVARLKGRAGATSLAGPGAAGATGPGGWLDWGPWAIGEGPQCAVHHVRGRARAPAHRALPLAAVEAHGPHLPVGCDTLVVESIARRAAALLGPGTYLCRPSRSAARRICAARRARRICRPTRCAWSCRTWRWRSTRPAFTGSR
jgi:creatinine amidohydrolase